MQKSKIKEVEAMNEYFYTKGNDGSIYRSQIIRDEDPTNCRDDWDNLCDMYIWRRGYNLADDTKGKDMWDILDDLMYKYLPKTETEDMSERDMMLALQSKANDKVKIYPIWVYEHSGITISMAGGYPYNDRWDGGVSGIIIAERERIEEAGCDWSQVYDIANGEVEDYDMYLVGDVYGYITDKYLGNDEWDENVDSCWGFYSRKWGEELAEEILGKLISETEAEELCAEYDAKIKAEEEAREFENWLDIVSAIVA